LFGNISDGAQMEWIKERVEKLEDRAEILEMQLSQTSAGSRVRRDVTSNNIDLNNLSEDGVPILERRPNDRRRGEKNPGQGLRIYDEWFRHRREKEIPNDPRVVWNHPTDSPVRAHHRKSASWVNQGDDSDYSNFATFGETVYTDRQESQPIKSNSDTNTINVVRNRAKVTNIEEYKAMPQVMTTIEPAAEMPRNTQLELNDHMKKVEMTSTLQQRKSRNRGAVRSGERRARRRHRNRSGVRSGRGHHVGASASVRPAIHLVGNVRDTSSTDYEGAGRLRVRDGVFQDWTPARWAKRMKLDKQFPMSEGKLSVSSPGVYFVYAQINYLDEHDVNAFQIYVNDDPFLLCTTMTHTPHFTTKANTCYTGGVVFLEQGDKLFIRNLETNRFAVLLPSHSFFGVVQLSQLGI